MTLTEAGKVYIAKNFGINDCFVSSGFSWTAVSVTGDTAEEEGGTSVIVGELATPSVYKEIRIKTPTEKAGTYTYDDLKAANDNTDVTLDDASWIADNDGDPAGEAQWCITAVTPTPTPSPTPTPTPVPTGKGWLIIGTFPGDFSVYLDGNYKTTSPELPTTSTIEVSAPTTHTLEYKKSGYITETLVKLVPEGEKVIATAFPEAVAGPNTGTLRIEAYDKETKDELHAKVGIYGISGEKKYLTPFEMTVKARDYSIKVSYPGYEEWSSAVTVSAGETEVVKAELERAKAWTEVAIGMMPAWILTLNIPRWINYNVPYDGYIRIYVSDIGTYYCLLRFYAITPEFERTRKIEDLKEPIDYTVETDALELTPYPEPEKKLEYSATGPTEAIAPAGRYVVVAELYII